MASNDFLPLNTTTELTLLYDAPKEGSSRFGPYRAYRVQTPDGSEHTFFPPRSLYPELDRLNLRRGSCLSVRASQRIADDGRVFPRFDIAGATDGPAPSSPAAVSRAIPNLSAEKTSMLACVALKAATASGSALSDPESVLTVAERYLAWLMEQAG